MRQRSSWQSSHIFPCSLFFRLSCMQASDYPVTSVLARGPFLRHAQDGWNLTGEGQLHVMKTFNTHAVETVGESRLGRAFCIRVLGSEPDTASATQLCSYRGPERSDLFMCMLSDKWLMPLQQLHDGNPSVCMACYLRPGIGT